MCIPPVHIKGLPNWRESWRTGVYRSTAAAPRCSYPPLSGQQPRSEAERPRQPAELHASAATTGTQGSYKYHITQKLFPSLFWMYSIVLHMNKPLFDWQGKVHPVLKLSNDRTGLFQYWNRKPDPPIPSGSDALSYVSIWLSSRGN